MFAEAVAEATKGRDSSAVSSEPIAFGAYALAKSGKAAEAQAALDELLTKIVYDQLASGSGEFKAHINLSPGIRATTKLRLRAPSNAVLKTVSLNGKVWSEFHVKDETITIPPGNDGPLSVTARY